MTTEEALAFIDQLRARGPLSFEGFGIKVAVGAPVAHVPKADADEKPRMTAGERMKTLTNPLVNDGT